MKPELEEPVCLEMGGLFAKVYPGTEGEQSWQIIVWRKSKGNARAFEFIGSLERAEGFASGLLVAFNNHEI